MRDSAQAVQQTASRSDVLVIGGGPGGATIAALLAERGREVVLIEKARHPRFHIGESLLPLNMPLFEQLGVADEMKTIGMPKYGAEFVSPWHPAAVTFDFANAVDKSFPYAYQVRRSEFDHILFRNAVRKGAVAVEGCRATGVEFNTDGAAVTVRHDDGREENWHTKFVVDASGRDTLLASQFGTKRRNPAHNSAAIFGHFSGATRHAGKAEGNISLFWFDHGWFWFIPLNDGVTSIGAVCWPYYMKSRKTDPQTFFLETIALCPALAERLHTAKLCSPVTATGNYSYAVKRATGRNYLLLGDAFTFIDPVFSTGVLFAMQSAFAGAETVTACLDNPAGANRALRAFDRSMHHGPKIFSWFIYRVTTPTLRDLFMGPGNAKIQEAVLSVLAGDIFRDTPLGLRLFAFKLVYYARNLFNPRRTLSAWKKRKQILQAPPAESTPA
ncbi:MAG TPA: NAD(P)/FAD-dependent oxidoreductase [Burkholderiales bacterium]|jgi:flavin-dependent dehydrogenase|nr:NAD(P)/FAD-dependent oxidoreductase [Burkholderiales bacterium]